MYITYVNYICIYSPHNVAASRYLSDPLLLSAALITFPRDTLVKTRLTTDSCAHQLSEYDDRATLCTVATLTARDARFITSWRKAAIRDVSHNDIQ